MCEIVVRKILLSVIMGVVEVNDRVGSEGGSNLRQVQWGNIKISTLSQCSVSCCAFRVHLCQMISAPLECLAATLTIKQE